MIFARKTTWRSRLDLEYLDETSNRKVSARQQHDDSSKKSHARPLKQFADYASKETLGQVRADGFLHHLILFNKDGIRTAPSQILASPQKLEEHLSKRLDSDRIIFSQKLHRFQMDALRNTQTGEAIHLQQLYQSLRNLEASITAKRQYFALKHNAHFVSQLVGRRTPKAVQIVEKLAAAVDRRSLREMQNLLFKIKRGYHTAHKRYAQIYGFSSYANRSTLQHAHRQQNAF